jgi:uncharacterized RDD family membrane protein YckC
LPGRSATFGARLGAGAIDWLICGALSYLVTILVALISGGDRDSTVGVVAFAILVSAPIVAYFAFFWARGGATPGMRAVGLRTVDEQGRPLGVARALLRAVAALASAASVLVILVTAFSDEPDGGYSAGAVVVLVAALAFAALSLLGHLWLLVDRRQTWHDRVFGLAVVPAEALAAEPASSD